MKDSINIAIAGATGYIGLELIKILIKHPKAKILYLCATKSIGKSIHKLEYKLICQQSNLFEFVLVAFD